MFNLRGRVIGPIILGIFLIGCGSQSLTVDRTAAEGLVTVSTVPVSPIPAATTGALISLPISPTKTPSPTPAVAHTQDIDSTRIAREPTPVSTRQPATPVSATAKQPTLDCTPHSFPQRTQRSLAVDPTDDETLYIGVEQPGFFKSADGGETWRKVSTGIKAWDRLDGAGVCYEEFYSTIIDPSDPSRICISMAGGPGTVALLTSAGNNGVYCSDDGAETWEQRVGPTMNAAVYALAADPRDFGTMYAGVNGGPCSNLPPVCGPETYFNTTGAIYKTTDGGATWLELDALYHRNLRVISVQVDQNNPDVIVAATFSKLSGPGQDHGNFEDAPQLGLLRSVDGGLSWSSFMSGMSDDPRERALLGMKTAPANGSRMFLTASSNTSYWSEDGGRSFHNARRIAAFAFDPHDPTGLYLLGSSGGTVS